MTAQGSGQTVLVVDDDASIRSALARALSAHGWAVRTCADGQEALELLASGFQPAVILLDQDMPKVDGRQFLAALRSAPRDGVPRIIRMSARDWPGEDSLLLEKPFTMELLLTVIG